MPQAVFGMEIPQKLGFLVKRYAVRKAKKWSYALRRLKTICSTQEGFHPYMHYVIQLRSSDLSS